MGTYNENLGQGQVGSTFDKMSDRVKDVLDDAETRLGDAGSKVSRFTSKARKQAGVGVEKFEDLVEAHPIAMVCAGLGIGYILGRIMARG